MNVLRNDRSWILCAVAKRNAFANVCLHFEFTVTLETSVRALNVN